MEYNVPVSERGLMVIPAPLRRQLNMVGKGRVTVTPDGEGGFAVKPMESIEARLERIRALAKTKPRLTDLSEDEVIEQAAVEDYLESMR